MDEEITLTELEQSRADTGFRYYVCEVNAYNAVAAHVDASRGYPNAQGTTLRGLPLVDELSDATDGSGKLIAVNTHHFNTEDDVMLQALMGSGVDELTQLEFLSVQPQSEEL